MHLYRENNIKNTINFIIKHLQIDMITNLIIVT